MVGSRPFMSSSQYLSSINAIFDQILIHETDSIDAASRLCADAIIAGGVVHCFGTGHSALHVADAFYRAGGLACLNPIMEPSISVHAGSLISTWMERQSGLAGLILDRYELREGEPMIIFSVSGINCVPVEVAAVSRARGLRVIAVTSRAYCRSVSGAGVRSLLAEADQVIDNHVPPGDAVLTLNSGELRACPASTVAVALIYNLILEGVIRILMDSGVEPPIFASSNLPGAPEHNRKLIAQYRHRIRHL